MTTGLVPTEFPFQAAIGVMPGFSTSGRTGVSDNVPFANPIILSNVTSANYPYNQPLSAQQMQIVSTSASDSSAGTGIQQVTITYLTAPFPINTIEPFKKKTEVVTLNGITPVLTNATDIFRIDRIVPNRVGSSYAAVGAVSLQSVGGVLTYERIEPGRTNGDTAAHYVEKGYGTLVTGISFGCTTIGGTILFLRLTEFDSSRNPVNVGQFTIELANSAIARDFVVPKITTNPDGREVSVIMTVKGRAANQEVSGSFDFIDYPL